MGVGVSQLHFPPAAVAVAEELGPLARTSGTQTVRDLSARIHDQGTSCFLTSEQLQAALGVGDNAFFAPTVHRIYLLLRQRADSTKVSGLDLVAALALLAEPIASASAKAATVFEAFDLDGTGVLDSHALRLLFRSCVQGLAKCTRGLAVELDKLGAFDVAADLTAACLAHAGALGLASRDGSVTLRAFSAWATSSPAVAALVGALTVGSRLHPAVLRKRQCRGCGRPLPQLQLDNLRQHPWRDLEHPAVRSAPERVAILRLQCLARAMAARRRAAARRAALEAQRHEAFTASALRIQGAYRRLRVARRLLFLAHAEGRKFRGAVLTAGAGSALGGGNAERQPRFEVLPRFKLDLVDLTVVATAPAHAAAVSSTGQLFVWGQSFAVAPVAPVEFECPEPAEVKLPGGVGPFAQLACGNSHSVAVTASGAVYTWGAFGHGELGHGDEDQAQRVLGDRLETLVESHAASSRMYVAQPTLVRYFDGDGRQPRLPVKQVACGYYFSIALTDAGEVFTWGEGSEGQLGHGTEDMLVGYADEYLHRSVYTYQPTPRRVDELANLAIAFVAAGGNRASALGSNHVVFEWGQWGRRLPSDRASDFTPQLLRNADNLALSQIAIGDEHTLAVGGSLWLELLLRPGSTAESVHVMTAAFGPALRTIADDRTVPYEVVELRLFEEDEDREPLLGDPEEAELERLRFDKPDVSVLLTLADSSDDESETPEHRTARRWAARCTGYHARPTHIDPVRASPLLQEHMRGDRARPLFQDVLAERFRDMRDKICLLQRQRPAGVYVRVMGGPGHGLEVPVVPAKFSPSLSKRGIESHLFFSPLVAKSSALLYHVGKNQFPGAVALLEFSDDDLDIADEDSNVDGDRMVGMLMKAMARRVYQAQRAGALAVVMVFNFQGAEPFELEDRDGLGIFIPALMVDADAGAELKRCVGTEAAVVARVFRRVDALRLLVEAAQGAGAAGYIVQQGSEYRGMDGEVKGEPVTMRNQQLSDYARNLRGGNVPDHISIDTRVGITTVCGMVSHGDGNLIRRALVNAPPLMARFVVEPTGNTYAWGYAESGRLGLGDVTQQGGPFEVGFSESQGDEYLCVPRPALVGRVAGVHARCISAGSEHSALVSADGLVYTWGAGDDGRLGHGQAAGDQDESAPRVVESLCDFEAVKAVASDTHTTVLLATSNDEEMADRRRRRKARLGDPGRFL